MPASNARFGARGAVARRKGITNLKVITPLNFYCQPPCVKPPPRWQQPGRTERADIDGVN